MIVKQLIRVIRERVTFQNRLQINQTKMSSKKLYTLLLQQLCLLSIVVTFGRHTQQNIHKKSTSNLVYITALPCTNLTYVTAIAMPG